MTMQILLLQDGMNILINRRIVYGYKENLV